MDVVDHITDLVGRTPMLRLNKLATPDMAEIFLKLERFNPGGSVKDRPALSMIEMAEKAGLLKPGMKIVEPTSGNLGIGIAMVAAAKGYQAILVMPDTLTNERHGRDGHRLRRGPKGGVALTARLCGGAKEFSSPLRRRAWRP